MTGCEPPSEITDVARLIADRDLHAVYQPIADFAQRAVVAHEGLIRGPSDSPLHLPAALFGAANIEGNVERLEFHAAQVIFTAYAQGDTDSLLFVNFSASAITQLGTDSGRQIFLDTLLACRMPARSLVVEITEHERVDDRPGLAHAISFLRSLGVAIALDDFGDGKSSLRLWAELEPEYVKIDRYFCHGIHTDGKKVRSVKAMLHLAEDLGSHMIAEGVEDADDLLVIRDLGVAFVQGYAIGKPAAILATEIPAATRGALGARDIAVFPELRRAFQYSPKAAQLLIPAPAIDVASNNQALLELFQKHVELHAIAVLDGGRPVGLVNRRRFIEKYLLPYYPEIYGRKSCKTFMDADPVAIEISQPIEELVQVLTSDDQRYLSDGYILVDGGRYVGIGTAERLVRSVTELRIESARHANPLTFLPGNIPISEHIRRLLAGNNDFGASYCDLNHFKPFNDRFGYWHGDKMIRLLASVIVSECNPQRDFAGHVGGDDFVVLFQSSDWRIRCARIVARFNAAAPALYDSKTRIRGFIEAEDRQGNPSRFPLTTLSIGALQITAGAFTAPEDVASAAAAAKHRAKKLSGGLFIENEASLEDMPAAAESHVA